jgi:hypothetical protein
MRTSSSALDARVLLAAEAWIARPESHDLPRCLRTVPGLLTLLGDLGGVRALVCWEAGGQAETTAPPARGVGGIGRRPRLEGT